MTLGVEEEFLIVDAATGELVARGGELFEAAHGTLGDDVAKELNLCQIEIGTPVCHDLAQVRAELTRLRVGLNTAAASIGTRIAATATHPFGSWRDQQIDPDIDRYRRIADVYQVIARQQVIAGCHVHVGIEDRDLAVAVMNRARPWIPALVALAANSPFWQGVDTGYASYRLQIWQRWPTSGMPPRLGSAAEFDALVQQLIAMEAIEDATFIYWYARPSARYPTLEFRACDVCLDVDTTVAVAGLVRSLAWACRRDELEGRPELPGGRESLDAAMWRAGRYGLRGTLVSPAELAPRPAGAVIDEMLRYVGDGLDAHGDRDEVTTLVQQVMKTGNGAERQREARRRGGNLLETVREVVSSTAALPSAASVIDERAVTPEPPSSVSFAARIELPDEPNSLARVAAALGALRANIVDIDIHEIDGAVVDEIVLDAPATVTADAIRAGVTAAGARRADVRMLPSAPERDVGVRSLELASRMFDTGDPVPVAEVIADVVPIDSASFEALASIVVTDVERTRLAFGMPVAVTHHDVALSSRFEAIVPRVAPGAEISEALVVNRRSAPFSATEVARLRALLRLYLARVLATDESPATPAPFNR